MDFRVDEDQQALQEGVRAFCEDRVPLEALPELVKQGGIDRALWRELAELGVFNLRLPEAQGGVGLGYADAVLIFAELGRRAVPGPLVWSHLAAGLVEGAASGDVIVGGLDQMVPSNAPILVEQLAGIDALLVLRPEGVLRLDARDLRGDPVENPSDPLTPVTHVAELPAGERIGDAAAARRLRRDGAALVSGQLLGLAETSLALAVEYSKGRQQFKRPIGSFQALKHIMADMYLRQEQARAAAYAAGATLDDPEVGDPDQAVAVAKLICEEAAHKNARACIQIYGGMGFTWEMPPHYYLKRTWVLETLFGGAQEHAEALAAAI